MSADVEMMAYVGKTPWHGLGKEYPEGTMVASSQMIVDAGLDWDVEVAKIVTNDQLRTAVDSKRVVRRVTDQAILGIVNAGWRPIQNKDAFTMFDNTIIKGHARYETAASLQGGSKVFILAKMPEVIEIGKGDPVERYLLLSNAHDGTRPLQMLFTPVRVVCSNTLAIALRFSSGDHVTKIAPRVAIKHSANNQKFLMKEAERVMGAAVQYYEKFGDFAKFLASKQVTTDVAETILEIMFPPNKKEEITPTIQDHRDSVEHLFMEGKGQDIPSIKGSAWALLNAFGEYADHGFVFRSKKCKEPQDRAYSIWMGGAKGLKERAGKVISRVYA